MIYLPFIVLREQRLLETAVRAAGLPEEEGRAVLRALFDASLDPAVLYRHAWRPGDLVLWDNRAVMHLATGCPPDQARTLHRTTIKGSRPVGPV